MRIGRTEQRMRANKSDLGGLSCADRVRIEAIGFNAWMSEQGTPTPEPTGTLSGGALEYRQHQRRTWVTCVCGKRFLAKRRSARYCSDKCRQRACRSGCHAKAAEALLVPA